MDYDRQTFQTVCGMCNGMCGLEITMEHGTIVGIGALKDSLSQGHLCPKGKAIAEIVHAPDRLRKPVRKTNDGQWQEISWDEALDLISDKLLGIKARFGAKAVAVHVGQTGVRKEFTPYLERFCSVFGTPNCSSSGSHCHVAKAMANVLTYGALPVPDYANSACIVLWGSDPVVSCPPLMKDINKALADGAKLLVVDPRVTPLARKADIHLQLRPGTDGALALGILNVIIEEKLINQDFVNKWTIGFAELTELVKDYSPSKVEQITWVPADRLIDFARLIALSSSACVTSGLALELQTNGFQTLRAIAILQAITGNLDVSGGASFVPLAKFASLVPENIAKSNELAIGQKEYPFFYDHTHRAQANLYAEAILTERPYSIKGMIVAGSNPILTWPNTEKVMEALTKLEFLVVMDHFMTETAKLADLVLPASTFLSRTELWNGASIYGIQKLGLSPQVLKEEECLTDWNFWNQLAQKMGYKESFPWGSEEEALNFRLEPLGLSVESLKQYPEGYEYGIKKFKKYETTGFKTPSGKVEIYCKDLEERGCEPLPVYVEPHTSPPSTSEMAKKYPLILTGARNVGYYHSRYRNIPSLRKLSPEPLVELHPDLAKELGVEDGEEVIVESWQKKGIALKVKVTETIDSRVISIPHGWDEANVNFLTDDLALDPVTGFPAYRSLLARLIKKADYK
ncbi:molybdopterin-containing oxidoreductase family protein [Desulfosporosinus nitroreducens]|uniref:Molybdopterin-dependent oxidoreductase n=1 Tax=Desulfosporosinus nitroreducens TaxID=2018668 RepID=A0ABT8QMS8_9FIRM|nr:molybdopterin-dependent oxidoreductase [Desulfosporosinus nitroreducens]MDO0821251.1 molybdopterin-dependent oxidoreductase [Desulfosporosinus nitroreducens]